MSIKNDFIKKVFKTELSKTERLIYSLLITFIVVFLAHGFSFFNFIPQHDALNHSISYSPNHDVSLGRFAIPFYMMIRGNMSVPLVSGVLSALYISLTTYLICTIFDLSKIYQLFVITASLSVNISIIESNSTFQWLLDVYMLASLFSVLGSYFLLKDMKWPKYIIAALFYFLSMGLYMGEMVIGVTVLVIYVIISALRNEKKQIIKWITWGCTFCISAVAYVIFYKLSMIIFDTMPSTSYNSITNIRYVQLNTLLLYIKDTVRSYFSHYFGTGNMFGTGVIVCNFVLTIVFLAALIIGIVSRVKVRKLSIFNMLIVIVAISVIPILEMIMTILMQESEPRYYLNYGLSMLYPVYLIVICELIKDVNVKLSNVYKWCLVPFAVILIQMILFSNKCYTYQKLIYDRAVSISTFVNSDLNHIDGYVPGETEVVIIGRFDTNTNALMYDESYYKYPYQAFQRASFTYTTTFVSLSRLLGYEINCFKEGGEEYEYYSDLKEVEDMPAFPLNGYIKVIGKVVVVKLC